MGYPRTCALTKGTGKQEQRRKRRKWETGDEKRAFSFITACPLCIQQHQFWSGLLPQQRGSGDYSICINLINTQRKYYRPSRVLWLHDRVVIVLVSSPDPLYDAIGGGAEGGGEKTTGEGLANRVHLPTGWRNCRNLPEIC